MVSGVVPFGQNGWLSRCICKLCLLCCHWCCVCKLCLLFNTFFPKRHDHWLLAPEQWRIQWRRIWLFTPRASDRGSVEGGSLWRQVALTRRHGAAKYWGAFNMISEKHWIFGQLIEWHSAPSLMEQQETQRTWRVVDPSVNWGDWGNFLACWQSASRSFFPFCYLIVRAGNLLVCVIFSDEFGTNLSFCESWLRCVNKKIIVCHDMVLFLKAFVVPGVLFRSKQFCLFCSEQVRLIQQIIYFENVPYNLF